MQETATLRDNRPFRLLAVVQGLRATGFWLFWLGMLSLASFTLKASPGQVALVTAFGSGAFVLLSPFTGTLVDRTNAKWVFSGCLMLGAANALWLAAATQMWHIYLASFVSATAGALVWPSMSALIKGLVPEDAIAKGNSVINGIWEATLIGGPLLSGLLAAQVGPRAPMIVGSAVWTVAALTLVPLRFVPAHKGEAPAPMTLAALREGFSLVLRLADLRSLVAWGALSSAGFFVMIGLEPVFIRTSLRGGQDMLSWFYSVGGVGATIGSIAVARLVRRHTELPVVAAGLTATGVFFLLYVGIARWPHVLPLQAIIGCAFAVYITASTSLVQRRAPAILVGRAVAARRGLEESAGLTGSLIGAATATALGTRVTMAIAATLMTTAGVALQIRTSRLRDLARTEPTEIGPDTSSTPTSVIESLG